MKNLSAAVRGGITTVVLMANTKPTVDTWETLRYVQDKGKTTDIHVETCANVTLGMKGQELVATICGGRVVYQHSEI